LKLAAEGAQIAVASKSVEENPLLGGTIYSAVEDIENAGGKGLALQCDIRNEDMILDAIGKTVAHFGGIDILVNNASAITLQNVQQLETKRFDLMHDINIRGTYLVSRHCIPHLLKGDNPHILTLSPPINLDPKWFKNHTAYTISKYGMSMIVMGLAEELKKDGIGVNALWPKTTIETAAVKNLLGGEALVQMSRKPEIIADAAHYIFSQPAATCTGKFFIDEEVLAMAGITDLEPYAVNPGGKLYKDLFL
jgi:citronellol/citronellal dehydrogenase